MARRPKPWFRKGRGWFVTVDGKQVSLGSEKELAYKRFYELMREPKRPPVSRVSPLVSALLDDFLEWTRKHRAAGTFRTYQQRLQWFLDSLPNCLVAAELKPHHVQSWLDSHPDWSDTTKRGCVIAVQRAFRWSEKMGYIEASPLSHFEKPSATSRDQLISEPEYQAILEMARDEPFRDLLTVHWETGCRPQESLRVEAKHVDHRNARWVFPPQEAKGKRRPRIVYLNDTALAITTKWLLRSPEGPIFRNTSGNRWTPYAVNCRFERIKKQLGTKYCLYLFRHSFATRLLQAGLDALTVAILLGHANPAMLSTTYQHLAPNPQFLLDQLKRVSA